MLTQLCFFFCENKFLLFLFFTKNDNKPFYLIDVNNTDPNSILYFPDFVCRSISNSSCVFGSESLQF